MKQFIIILVAAIVGGTLVWFLQSRSKNESSAPASASAPSAKSPAPSAAASSPATDPAKKAAATTPGAAEKLIEELKDQVVVTFGKVEDIGRQAGDMLLSEKELAALQAMDAASRTPEQNRRLLELERQRAAALGALPEIEHFQDNPDEYARFFGSLLQAAGDLDAVQTRAVTDYMRSRGQAMVESGLNAAKEPTDPEQEEAWEEKRDAFNEETVEGVAKILPPGTAERIGFTDKFIELMEQDFDKAK